MLGLAHKMIDNEAVNRPTIFSILIMTFSRIKINSIGHFTWTLIQEHNSLIIPLNINTTQNTTGSSASAQTSKTILNIAKRYTSWTRPFRDYFTLRASRLDSSSWRVRVKVSGEKLVDQTTKMILWSMILCFVNFDLVFVDQWRAESVESFNCKWNDGMVHWTADLLQMQWRPSELTKFKMVLRNSDRKSIVFWE